MSPPPSSSGAPSEYSSPAQPSAAAAATAPAPAPAPASSSASAPSSSVVLSPASRSSLSLLSCGLVSGFLQAGLFNPWDRALYLSIKENRPFLSVENFRHPWSGVIQTIFQRALSAGLYFPLEEIYSAQLRAAFVPSEFSSSSSKGRVNSKNNVRGNDDDASSKRRPLLTFAAGMLSGITSGIIMNPISAVKYHYWGTPTGKENFYTTAMQMARRGGLRIFIVGTGATVSRDLVFGGAYSLLRHELLSNSSGISSSSSSSSSSGSSSGSASYNAKPSFLVNLVAACSATILSSPWNYVRNVHYATEKGAKPLSFLVIMGDLMRDVSREPTLFARLRFLQAHLRIGWGTARVGAGMAFGAFVYDLCSQLGS